MLGKYMVYHHDGYISGIVGWYLPRKIRDMFPAGEPLLATAGGNRNLTHSAWLTKRLKPLGIIYHEPPNPTCLEVFCDILTWFSGGQNL